MSNKDNYRPAGGKFNPFETPLKSAMEETFEETGVKVDIMKFRGC
jgi:8-oxo-dGTP diphosphatase